MAIWCKCFMSLLISFLGILSFFDSLIGCSQIAPLTPVADGDERVDLANLLL